MFKFNNRTSEANWLLSDIKSHSRKAPVRARVTTQSMTTQLVPIYDLSHCSNVFMQIKPVKTCTLLWSVRCTTNIRSEDYVFHVPVSIIGGDFFYFYADSESSTIPQVQLNIDFSLWVQKLLLQLEQFRRRARPLSSLEPGVDKYSPSPGSSSHRCQTLLIFMWHHTCLNCELCSQER